MVAIAAEAAGVGRLPGEDVVQQEEETFGEDFLGRAGPLRGQRGSCACLCCALVIRGDPHSFIIRARALVRASTKPCGMYPLSDACLA